MSFARKKDPKSVLGWGSQYLCIFAEKISYKALQDKTPYEAWYGNKQSKHHLKNFGCIFYYRVPETKRSKLNNKAHKGIFMGYSSFKGYNIFCLKSDKLILSREVKFVKQLVEIGKIRRPLILIHFQ